MSKIEKPVRKELHPKGKTYESSIVFHLENLQIEKDNAIIEQYDLFHEQVIKDIVEQTREAVEAKDTWLSKKVAEFEEVLNKMFKDSGDKQIESVEKNGLWECDLMTLSSKDIVDTLKKHLEVDDE